MNKTHGMSGTPEYQAWHDMKRRCFNHNTKQYLDWGGRGITVCDRWLDFENFLADMGSRPTSKHSLDRIDNDGDYSAENCKWATKAEQQNNKRNNKPLIKIDDVTLTITQWAKKMGYGEMVIQGRLNLGWSDYDAVMTPVETGKLITIENDTRTIVQWENKMGYGKNVIQGRLNLGWSEYRAVMTPVKQRKTA